MVYCIGMNNERDPITEWEHAIGSRIGSAMVVCVLLVVVAAMVAPIFGGVIKNALYREYALYDDCEQRVTNTMKSVRIWLWTLAIVAWIVVIILG